MDLQDEVLPLQNTSTPIRVGCKRMLTSLDSSPIISSQMASFKRKHILQNCTLNIENKDDDRSMGNKNEYLNVLNAIEKSKEKSHSKRSPIKLDLLLEDDSFLESVDVNFASLSKYEEGGDSNNKLQSHAFSPSPDIFADFDCEGDDLAWDMSITVDKKHELVGENVNNNSKETNKISFLNQSVNWSDESGFHLANTPKQKECHSTAQQGKCEMGFGERLKNILLNNAFKPLPNISNSDHNRSFSPNSSKNNSFYGLPPIVKSLIKKYKGISKLYDWQDECLQLPAIQNKRNLVYALPTSGGKTLVAEILMLKTILCKEKDVILVLPYVSIVQEKVRSLAPFAVDLGFLIEEYAGAKGQYPPQKRMRKHTIFIATIEKSLGLVHSYIETKRISELGLVVIDELHLIGESRRGASLEAIITKLMYTAGHVHIIGMSATIGNIDEIAKFLKAEVYTHDFRPVELHEYIKVEDEVFLINMKEDPPLKFHSRLNFSYTPEMKQLDPDEIGGLVGEVAPDESCLVFCASKKNCENVALLICRTSKRELLQHKQNEKKALYHALISEGNGTVCPTLCKILPYGVAYHNSSLTTAERRLIEEAFCAKTIFCICCTSTLAAGVNLPAKRVILRSPYIGTEFINLTRYKQMAGRAGRAGISNGAGESFILCKPSDTERVGDLLRSSMDFCRSQLREPECLSCFFLSAVGLSITETKKSLKRLLKCTLLNIQSLHKEDRKTLIDETLGQLVESGALKVKKDPNDEKETLSLTLCGKAAMKGCFDMNTANRIYNDLEIGKKSLVLANHLHLLYLITPYSLMDQVKLEQKTFITKFMSLDSNEVQVASVLGIDERYIAQMMSGRKVKTAMLPIIHRFYLSLILNDLWKQKSVWEVSQSFQLSRGLVNTLLNSSVAFASSVLRFCEELDEMWSFRRLLLEVTSRLSHCCTPELISLMELPSVKIGRARQLYNAGFKTVNVIANTEPKALAMAVDHLPRKVAHQIVAAAKLKLMTTVETLQEEAESVLAILNNKLSQG